jgi:hypothetical protein
MRRRLAAITSGPDDSAPALGVGGDPDWDSPLADPETPCPPRIVDVSAPAGPEPACTAAVRVAPAGGGTALTLVIWFDTMPRGSLRGLVFTCSDLDADYQRLQALGVEFY